MTADSGLERIYHVTLASDWKNAQSGTEYRLSTRHATLDEVGYIHASFAHQVERICALLYGDTLEPIVVLVIDTATLRSPVTVENLEGGGETFPHIYGPLPTSSVVDVLLVEREGTTFKIQGLPPSA